MRPSTLIKILVTLLLLGFLASQMDLASLSRVLRSASLAGILLAVAIQTVNSLISVKRWQAILVSFRIITRFGALARLTFIGGFFSLFLPSSIGGDFFRAFYLAKQQKLGMSTTLTSTLMERSGGLCALLMIGIVASTAGNLVVHEISLIWVFLTLSLVYVLANIAIFNHRLHALLIQFLHRFHLENVESKMELVSGGLTTLISNYQGLAVILGTSLVIQFVSIVIIWTCAQALAIDAPFTVFLVFVPLINLSIMVPLTINGFGLRESLYFLLFTQIGVAEEQAVALSLTQAVVLIIAASPGGVFYSLHKRSAEDIEEPKESAESSGPDDAHLVEARRAILK